MTVPAGILGGLRVVELSAFVAAPLGGATLAAMGADVIRVDPRGGGIDSMRWPLHQGRSLYWAGLNQGKRSLTADLRAPRGQELVASLVTAAGPDAGIVLTNLPVAGWMAYERLSVSRPDLIMLVITGNHDGSIAVDYTVNAALGFPLVTGPQGHDGPVNHVLPAWDVATGYLAAASLLAAERHRRLTGQGQLVKIALSDVGLAVTGHLGMLAEARLDPEPRGRYGNDVFGTYGRDFPTRDGRRVIVLALTPRQWRSLVEATGLGEAFRSLETEQGEELSDEGARFRHRSRISALIGPWIAERDFEEVSGTFTRHDILWGPYQSFKDLVAGDRRAKDNPMMAELGGHPVAGSPVDFTAVPRVPPRPGPRLGEHTEEVLRELLSLGEQDLRALRSEGVID